MSVAAILAASAVFIAAWMLAFWLASLPRRNAAIVDIGWGPGFAGVAVLAFAIGGGWQPRSGLVLALTSIWGLRLGGYLAWRNHGEPEDRRYQAMRRRHGDRFVWVSLYSVFALQGAVMWVVSLPVQLVMAAPAPAAWTPFDLAGVIVWAVGMLFEAVGNWQLARFKADPASRGQVMDRGLWRYTRHPNYFGDFCVWWGLWLLACAAPGGWWTAVGPAVMSFFLMKVSGVPLLERDLVRRRPAYAAYVRRTSAFFPRPPR